MSSMGVYLVPALTIEWFCPRVVWGGIWGFLFALPLFRSSIFVRGFLFSLVPTFAELFVVFPYIIDRGVMGFALGTLTPLFVLFFNLVWGFTGAFWARLTR